MYRASHPKDTVVTLTTQPSPGSIFLGWSSFCGYQPIGAPVPSLNQCQVKLNKARFVKTLPWPQGRIQTPLISGRHPEMSGFVSTGFRSRSLRNCPVPSALLSKKTLERSFTIHAYL